MSDKIILVTPPDDILVDAVRFLLVDLSRDQTQHVSDTLARLDSPSTIVLYMWNSADNVEWLLDKKLKSQAIIFNADSDNDIITGYMAAQSNAHYFGTLRSLSNANNRAIYNIDQIYNLMEKTIDQHG